MEEIKLLKLLPCPFCGGEAIVYRDGEAAAIGCRNCCAVEPTTKWFDTLDEAVAAWNTRKPVEDAVKFLRELVDICKDQREMLEKYGFKSAERAKRKESLYQEALWIIENKMKGTIYE